MSKRFTETDKWKDPSFLKMKPTEKLVWLYIMDNCNNAGFMEWDVDICAMFTGMKSEHVLGAYEGLKRGFKGAKDSSWIYIPEFLKLQKNLPLNPENNAHKQIISIVEDMRPVFASIAKELLGANKGLPSPIGKVGSSNGEGKVRVKDYTEDFSEFWKQCGKGSKPNAFKNWKSERDKPEVSELIKSHISYKSHCLSADRTLRDSQGWISGRMWESEWVVESKPQNKVTFL